MNSRRFFLSAALTMVLYSLAPAQMTNDTYRVKSGENVLRVLITNSTQEPLSGLILKFADSQPAWFSTEQEATFDIGTQSGEVVELPFKINESDVLGEPVTLELIAQGRILETIVVKLSPEKAQGSRSGPSANSTAVLENSQSEKAEEIEIPKEFALRQNYPNPFNPSTVIQFDLPEQSSVKIEIFDPLGRRVRALLWGEKAPGVHIIPWDGTSDYGETLSTGVYIYRLITPSFTQTRKMLLVR